MKQEDALKRIDEIHRIVERTTMFTLLPGIQAIVGGLLALIGCAVSYVLLGSFDFNDIYSLSRPMKYFFCLMWAGIIVISILQNILLTARNARLKGIVIGRSGRFTATALSPSVLVGIVISVKMLLDHQLHYVAPIWMMCYGVGIYAAGLFSVSLPRILGLAFLFAGAVGLLLFIQYGVLLIAFSFGLFHLLFGFVVLKESKTN